MSFCGHYLDVVHADPVVDSNPYLGAPQDSSRPPTYASVSSHLPHLFGSPWSAPGTPYPGRPSSSARSQPTAATHASQVSSSFNRVFQVLFSNLKAPTPGNDFAGPFADAAFNNCLFMWDAVFMGVFWKYAQRAHDFQSTFDTFYRKQLGDGFIPREIRESDGRSQFYRHDPHSTGPNVLPWCELEYFELTGDRARLASVFPPLLAYHRWMRQNRSWPDGSYHSCGYACGMDNQPRVLSGESVTASHSFTAWVDATAQALLSATSLVAMADILNSSNATSASASAGASGSHPGPGPANSYHLTSLVDGQSVWFGGMGVDGVIGGGGGGGGSGGGGGGGSAASLCTLLQVKGGEDIGGGAAYEIKTVTIGTGAEGGEAAFFDLKFGGGAPGLPVWAYHRNNTVSQHWVPFVVSNSSSSVGGGGGGGGASSSSSSNLLPYSTYWELVRAGKLPNNSRDFSLIFRSMVNPTYALKRGEGGGLCVATLEGSSSSPSISTSTSIPLPFLWRLTPVDNVKGLSGGPEVESLREEVGVLRAYLREKMWCERQGAFTDRRLRPSPGYPEGGEKSTTRSVGAYWTLVAGLGGCLGEGELSRFMGALDDPTLFNRPTRVPSLAANHPNYDPNGGYWLGSSWPPTTYMVLRALTAVAETGEGDTTSSGSGSGSSGTTTTTTSPKNAALASRLCKDIAANYFTSTLAAWVKHGTFFENQSPEAVGEPGNTSKPEFIGWGGIGPVAVALEYVWGLRPHTSGGSGTSGSSGAVKDALLWDITGCGGFGVSRYPWRGGVMHLECGEREGGKDVTPRLWVRTTKRVRLCVRWGGAYALAVGGGGAGVGWEGERGSHTPKECWVTVEPNMVEGDGDCTSTVRPRLWRGVENPPLTLVPGGEGKVEGAMPLFDLSFLVK